MSIEFGDLKRLVHDEMHIDEYQSKLGENRDVVVVSLKVHGKEPAQDICGFIEKGFDWVLDADVSSGEMDDGDYLVFIEFPRDKHAASNINQLMEDLMNLTDQDLNEWRVQYYKEYDLKPYKLEVLEKLIPQSPEEYDQRYGHKEIDSMKAAAGVKVTTKAPKNKHTESLRIAAGII